MNTGLRLFTNQRTCWAENDASLSLTQSDHDQKMRCTLHGLGMSI